MSMLEDEICFPISRCLVCESNSLIEVVNLGNQPLANSFTDSPKDQKSFPLVLMYCGVCTHLQLSHCVSREYIFKDYIYVSGTTETLKNDFKEFAQQITDKHGVGRVLDVACNDGSQLDAFKQLGWETWGIDPAENLYSISSRNHNIICDFLKPEHLSLGKFDVVIAQNVLAHTDKPLNFMQIISNLSENIYIQTSQADMIFDGQFDTIYHEHISFFSQESMNVLAGRAGLNLREVSKRPIHGVSFLFHLEKNRSEFQTSEKVTYETVQTFKNKVENTLEFVRNNIESARQEGFQIVGYGAAAKGMTVLNAIGIKLDFVIDDSPLKQGKFTPGLAIPILPITELEKLEKPLFLIPLAWNFAHEINSRVKKVYSGELKMLQYFPEMFVN